MDQDVAKPDCVPRVWNSRDKLWVGFAQLGKGFAEDFELALNSRAKQFIG